MNIQNDKALDIALGDYTVYKHTSPTGKVYIGITRNNTQRRWKGGHGYVNNTHFFRAIQRYGWDAFKHEVLFTGLTEAEAVRKERELIAAYDSTDPAKGYNRDPGGGVRSPETVAKTRAALTGRPIAPERRQRLLEAHLGKPLPVGHRRRISESHKNNPRVQAHILALNKARAGVPKTAAHRRKIAESLHRAVVNLDTGEVFISVKDAAASCGGSHPNIVKVCTGERQKAYGYRWAYKEVNMLCS